MKILIASDMYYPLVNGASYFTTRLSRALAAAGHEVAVICPARRHAYTDEIIEGVRVFGLPSLSVMPRHKFRITIPVGKQGAVGRIIDDFKPDIIHVQVHFQIVRMVLKAARERSIPVVGTNHFMPENLLAQIPFSRFVQKPLSWLAWKDFARALRSVQRMTAPTRRAAALTQPYFDREVLPISCGIDRSTFTPGPRNARIEERYGLSNEPRFLCVGRLDREKNLEVVFRAAARAIVHMPFQLVIAGDGPLREPLMRLAEYLDIRQHVVFTGFVPDEDLPFLYRSADFFIIAGTAELQSIVTMEAMASGLPIIAAHAVALPELAHDGENGFLFTPNDIEFLAGAMTKIMSADPERQRAMGNESLRIITQHDLRHTVEQFVQLYESELQRRK